MEIRITHIGYYKETGVQAMWCEQPPMDKPVVVTEEREVLYPAEGMDLKRIKDGELFSVVWLRNGDIQENYEEVEHEEPQIEEPSKQVMEDAE